jgi:hypothetical protein
MAIRISGTIVASDTKLGVEGLVVEAYDDDLVSDDLLGRVETDGGGRYAITVDGQGGLWDNPDVYLVIKNRDGDVLKSTYSDIRRDVTEDLVIDLTLSSMTLYQTNVLPEPPERWTRTVAAVREQARFRALTLLDGSDADDPLMKEVKAELEDSVSVLDLLAKYALKLRGVKENDTRPFLKLDALWAAGVPFTTLEGHYFGIGLGGKTHGTDGWPGQVRNMFNFIYTTFQGEDSAWVGKTLWRLDEREVEEVTDGTLKTDAVVYRGTNHFNQMVHNNYNPFFFGLSDFWLSLSSATDEQRSRFGVDRNGADYTGYATDSIFEERTAKIFRLCYRWPHFGNPAPIKWLIDEITQVAEGVYLGRLLCASRSLLMPFDVNKNPKSYGYRNWGYFLLASDDWTDEAVRLFPFLDILPHRS